MSDEAREKIMLGHGIVSPILLGIKDNTGFGNNAEELRTASVLMDNVIIRPLQDGVLDGLEQILAFNKINLDLYFVTLQPIEFTELDNISTKVKREEETGEKLSSVSLSADCDKEDCCQQTPCTKTDLKHTPEHKEYEDEVTYPHFMWNPETGEKVEINNEEDHEYYTSQGWVHEEPKNIQMSIEDVIDEVEQENNDNDE